MIVTIITVAACSALPERQTQLPMDDASVADRVVMQLTQTPGFEPHQFAVTSFKGSVQLRGTVGSLDEWSRAAKAARKVAGVQQLTNSLVIEPQIAMSSL